MATSPATTDSFAWTKADLIAWASKLPPTDPLVNDEYTNRNLNTHCIRVLKYGLRNIESSATTLGVKRAVAVALFIATTSSFLFFIIAPFFINLSKAANYSLFFAPVVPAFVASHLNNQADQALKNHKNYQIAIRFLEKFEENGCRYFPLVRHPAPFFDPRLVHLYTKENLKKEADIENDTLLEITRQLQAIELYLNTTLPPMELMKSDYLNPQAIFYPKNIQGEVVRLYREIRVLEKKLGKALKKLSPEVKARLTEGVINFLRAPDATPRTEGDPMQANYDGLKSIKAFFVPVLSEARANRTPRSKLKFCKKNKSAANTERVAALDARLRTSASPSPDLIREIDALVVDTQNYLEKERNIELVKFIHKKFMADTPLGDIERGFHDKMRELSRKIFKYENHRMVILTFITSIVLLILAAVYRNHPLATKLLRVSPLGICFAAFLIHRKFDAWHKELTVLRIAEKILYDKGLENESMAHAPSLPPSLAEATEKETADLAKATRGQLAGPILAQARAYYQFVS